MEHICIIADRAHRPFYEVLDTGEKHLTFYDPAEALESAGACGLSVMVLDAGHSPDTGLMLLKRIKGCCVTVPVIFLTDVSSEELAIAAFKAGAREYIKKPIDQAVLQATIQELAVPRQRCADTGVPTPLKDTATRGSNSFCLSSDLPDVILKSVRYLNEHLAEEIYLEEIANEAGMSRFHFCRIFKDHVGLTPMQFLTVTRIERAKVLLRKEGATIASVIYKVGFNDISEFNRQFKKMTGLTPSEFRKSLRKQDG